MQQNQSSLFNVKFGWYLCFDLFDLWIIDWMSFIDVDNVLNNV